MVAGCLTAQLVTQHSTAHSSGTLNMRAVVAALARHMMATLVTYSFSGVLLWVTMARLICVQWLRNQRAVRDGSARHSHVRWRATLTSAGALSCVQRPQH